MIQQKKILALIPARGGSKGIPGKNLKPLAGKPLLGWTIEAAKGSRYLDRLVLSSDDQAILEAGKRLGCDTPFVRPAELATDEATSVDVILHALAQLPGYDGFLLLQPTSPFRSAADIDAFLEAAVSSGTKSAVSVAPSPVPPHLLFRKDGQGRLVPLMAGDGQLPRRQDVPPAYMLNGALYYADVPWFFQHKHFFAENPLAFEMPAARSLDIDTLEDWEEADRLAGLRG